MASIWQKAFYSLPGNQGTGEDNWRKPLDKQNPSAYANIGKPVGKNFRVTPDMANWAGVANRASGVKSYPQTGNSNPVSTYAPQSGGQAYGSGAAGPSQEQLDAERAGELRKVIGAKRNRLNQLFDTLLDDVDRVTTARRGELQKSYDREITESREGFTQKSDELGWSFAGRGLADSTFRQNAEEGAATQFKRALDELGRQNQSALGELGQSAAEKRAAIGADRSSLAQINLDELKDDVSGLTQARNQISKMIIEAQRQRSSLDTPGGYRGRLDKISPAKGQAQALRAQLDALIQSNTPQVVKDAIASGLIGNYGGVDQNVWQQYYQTAQQKVATPQTTAPAPQPVVA